MKEIGIIKTLQGGEKLKYKGTVPGKELEAFIKVDKDIIFAEMVVDAIVHDGYSVIRYNLTELDIDRNSIYDTYSCEGCTTIYIQKCCRISDKNIISIYKMKIERLGEYTGKDIKCYMNTTSFGTIATYDMAAEYSCDIKDISNDSTYAVYVDNDNNLYIFNIDMENTCPDLTYYDSMKGYFIIKLKDEYHPSPDIYYPVNFKDGKVWYIMQKNQYIHSFQMYDVYITFYNRNLYIEQCADEKESNDTLSYIKNGQVYTGAQLRKYSDENKDSDINAFYLYQSFFKEHNLSRLDVDDDKEYRLLIKTNRGSYVSLIDIEEENRIKKYDNPDHEVTIFGKYYIPFDTKESYKFSEILSWLDYCKEKYENAKEGEDKSKYFLGYLAYKKYESKLNNFKPNQYCYLEFYNIEKIYSDIQTPISLEDLVMLVKDSKKEAEDIQEEDKEDPKTITYTDDKISEYVSKLGLDNDFKETLNGFMDYLQNGNS